MRYEDALDLTVTQIAALLTKESLPQGEVDPDLYCKIMKAI